MHHDPRRKGAQAGLPRKWSSAKTVGDKVCLAVLAYLHEAHQQGKPILTKQEILAALSAVRVELGLSSNDNSLGQQINIALTTGKGKLKVLGLVENDTEAAAMNQYAFKLSEKGQDFIIDMPDFSTLLSLVSRVFHEQEADALDLAPIQRQRVYEPKLRRLGFIKLTSFEPVEEFPQHSR